MPEDTETLTVTPAAVQEQPGVGSLLTVVSFNTGYAGLDRTQDFIMDGGKGVRPASEGIVKDNMSRMLGVLSRQNAQIVLLQEVDEDSARSFHVNQRNTTGAALP
jgi:hypothetical protein